MAIIDLSQLPPPDLVETLDYEQILAAKVADYEARLREQNPDAEPPLESDPAYKVLESSAYRETVLRARINRVGLANMLARSTGDDLTNLAALFGVERLVVTPADPSTTPPTPAVLESDTRLRRRAQLAPEGFSVAGPSQAYIFHALSASPEVLDAVFNSPTPAVAVVTILSTAADGAVSQALLDTVTAALSAEDIRPAGDQLTVQSATVLTYDVTAELEIATGPDPAIVRDAAEARLRAFVHEVFRVGRSVPLSGIYAALTVPNVLSVTLSAPAADVAATAVQAARAVNITVTTA